MIDERIKFRHLQCFLAVAQHGSLQKAAGVLSITQPAVSKTLKELEALLAVRLFERGRRGAVLTRSGDAFARHAGASVSALREAVASVAPTRPQGSEVVTLGVLPTVAPQLMPALLLQLDVASRASRPAGLACSLRIHTAPNPALLTQLRQRELDLVIGRFAEPAHMVGLTFEHLYADPLVLAVRPEHPLIRDANLRSDALAHLPAFTAILPTQSTAIRHTADSFLLTRGLGQLVRTVETLSVTGARNYTVRSDAVWFSPRGAVQQDLDSGLLAALPVSMAGTEELVGMSLRADMVPTAAQAEVIGALRLLAAAHRGLDAAAG
jgi:LysR family pca operon transcriptional activator